MTTVKRKEYYTGENPDGYILGLPYKEATEQFDGSVDVGNVHIEDAFDVNEIEISGNDSSGLMSLAAKVTAVKLQPRMIPSAITAPTISGLQCTKNDELPDGVWLDCGTTIIEAEARRVVAPSADHAALIEQVSEVLGIPCAHLWQIADGDGAANVSFADSGYSDGSVLMYGRSTMVGYPVKDAEGIVWTALGVGQIKALNDVVDGQGKSLLCRLLTMLGMPESMAVAEQTALSMDNDEGLRTLSSDELSDDGVITIAGEWNPLVGKSRLLYNTAQGAKMPWIKVTPDGASMFMWLDNKADVFALLAGMARKAMDGIMGLGLVGVGKNGGVMWWMVSLSSTYNIPIVKILSSFANCHSIKNYTHAWLTSEIAVDANRTNGAYIDLGINIKANNIVIAEIKTAEYIGYVILGDYQTTTSEKDEWRMFNHQGKWYFDNGSGTTGTGRTFGGTFNLDTRYEVEIGNNYIKDLSTNTNIISGTQQSYSDKTYTYKFLNKYGGKASVRKIVILDAERNPLGCFLPFSENGQNGLIDVMTNTKKYSATSGSFTYSLE